MCHSRKWKYEENWTKKVATSLLLAWGTWWNAFASPRLTRRMYEIIWTHEEIIWNHSSIWSLSARHGKFPAGASGAKLVHWGEGWEWGRTTWRIARLDEVEGHTWPRAQCIEILILLRTRYSLWFWTPQARTDCMIIWIWKRNSFLDTQVVKRPKPWWTRRQNENNISRSKSWGHSYTI